MKTKIWFFILFPFTVFGQIDYPKGLELISTKSPFVTITWIKDASREVPLYFDQQIVFVNSKNDSLFTSRVIVTINHNSHPVKTFEFKVGQDITNHLYTSNPIKLKNGDNVTIQFELKSTSKNEEYVFNIFERKQSSSFSSSKTITQKTTPIIVLASNKQKVTTTNSELKRLRRTRTVESIFKLIAH